MKFKIGDKVFIGKPKETLESYYSVENQRVQYITIIPSTTTKKFDYTFFGFAGIIINPYLYPHDFNPQRKLYYDWNVKLFLPYNIVVPMCEEQLKFANTFQIRSCFKRKSKHHYK